MNFLPDRTLVIAEIGSNHDGDLDKALRLIDVAAESGADVAKFQSFLADEMYTPADPMYALLKQLEIPKGWYPQLIDRCEHNGIRFLSTATNDTTLDWMEELGVDWYKVASGNISHQPLIDRLIDIGKPIIFSTGVATLDEIVDLTTRLHEHVHEAFAFLHCVSQYPTPPEHIRLGNIRILQELLDCPIGFSDHSETPYLALAAVALGARIVEKHLTLDGVGISPDHAFALTPVQLRTMVDGIREVECGLFADFSPNREVMFSMRRSLHFASDLKAGHVVTASDLKIIRPEDGLPPARLHEVIGKKLRVDVKRHEPVDWQQIEVSG